MVPRSFEITALASSDNVSETIIANVDTMLI